MTSLEVLFTSAEFATLPRLDLTQTTCVVFDVLRATTTMVTALGQGAAAILPVQGIADALAARSRWPEVLLAGERDGVRIGAELAGSAAFDLGNSPREFTGAIVRGKTIVMTTTNGTRALSACRGARRTLVGSFLNLDTVAQAITRDGSERVLVVCSGTLDQAAYEDVLGAGALCDRLWPRFEGGDVADSAGMARELFRQAENDLPCAMKASRNARRLLSRPELRDDVAFCLQRDSLQLVAALDADGWVKRE